MPQQKTTTVLKASLFAALLLLGLFYTTEQAASADKPLKLGVLVCLSGSCAEWGQNSLKAVQLAVKEINQGGGLLGRRVELVVQDTQEGGTGANSVTAYHQLLTNPEVKFVIGPTWSIGGMPLASIIAKNKDILVTSPSLGIADFNETADNIFNIWPHDAVSTKALAEYAINKGWQRAAIFGGTDPWELTQGLTFEQEFKRLGGQIVLKVEVYPDTSDVKPEALRIKRSNPDVVFYSAWYAMGTAAKELKRLNYQGNQLAILMDQTRMSEAAGALSGTVFVRYPEASAPFRQKFKQQFEEAPGIAADTAYDAVKLYEKAILNTKSFDPETVKKALLSIDYTGVTGKVVFDEHGGVIRAPLFWSVSGEEFQPLG